MQQYQDGDIADGPNGALVMRGGQWVPLTAPTRQGVVIPRPAPPPREAPTGYRWRADGSQEPIPGGPATPKPPSERPTPDSAKVRQEALAGYRDAQELSRIADRIEKQYRADIKNGGIDRAAAGLIGAYPSAENRRFNDMANQARGYIKKNLQFTGGEANTAMEQGATYGPYLPQAGDYNAQIEGKITALRELAVTARDKSVAQLGGTPNAIGRIDPQAQPFQISTDVKETKNPEREKVLSALIRGGADIDTISSASMSLGGDRVDAAQVDAMRAYLAKNPRYKGPVVNSVDRTPTTTFEQMAGGPGGAFFANAANAVTGNNLDSIVGATGGDAERARADIAGLSQAGPGNQAAGLFGNIAGGALAAGGMELGAAGMGLRGMGAARGADLAYGGIAGAGDADGGTLMDRLSGGAAGAVAGLGGGIAGRAAVRGVGAGFRGVRDANTNLLNDAGVPLTVGQAAGGALKGVEDRLAGLPFIGDAINQRRREGFGGFADATRREALAPIGAVPGPQTGAEAIPAMRGQVGAAYNNALDNVRVTADPQFTQGMAPIVQGARALPDPMAGNLDYTLRTRVGQSFDDAGNLNGNGFQQSVRGLRQDTASLRNQPYGNDFANGTRAAEGELEGLLNRQAPGAVPAYQAANTANRRVSILRDATAAARNGTRTGENFLYAPSQVADAANANAKRFGQQQGTPEVPFYGLTNAGQSVLPSKVPDSGTAGRALLAALLPSAVAGGAGYGAGGVEGGLAGLGVAGAGAALYSRGGQRQLVNLLMNRSPRAQALGGYLNQQAGLGGMFGASTGVASIPYFTGQ